MLVALAITIIVGYLLGSLPFGYLVARAKGVNIFEVGSKNPGATNVRRVLGSGPGNLVLALDALKGMLATFAPLGFRLMARGPGATLAVNDYGYLGVAGLLAAMLGHSFSCFTHFKGGKGVATGAGGFLVLFPPGMLIALIVWGLTTWSTRYVSLASMLAATTLPVSAWLLGGSPLLIGVSAAVAVFVIVRHRQNIVRILNGTENKLARRGAAPKS